MDIVSESQKQKMHPHKFTMWVAIGSIVMMFAGLTSAFIVKSNQTNFRLVKMPDVFWISTVLILLSSLSLHLAVRAVRQKEMKRYRLLVVVTAILGAGFVFCQWLGFKELWSQQITLSGSDAGQFLYVIFGLHAVHVIGGIIALVIILLKAFAGRVKVYTATPAEVASIYWHFVDLLWIYLLIFFMIIGGA